MSLPGSVELTQATSCATSPATGGACLTDQETLCLDPFYALANPDACTEISVSALRLEPADIETVVGRRACTRVIATFSNGKEADVTDLAEIDTESDDTAEHLGDGVVQGRAAGEVWVEATWNGFAARGTATVNAADCRNTTAFDVVLVLDTNVVAGFEPVAVTLNGATVVDAYWRPTPAAGTDWEFSERLRSIARAFQVSLSLKNTWDTTDTGNDRIAILATGPRGVLEISGWTDTVVDVQVNSLLGGQCGKALVAAQALHAAGRSSATKLVVLVTTGAETSCNPSIAVAAGDLDTAGIKVAIVTPTASNSTMVSGCNNPTLVFAYLLGSCTADDLFKAGATNANVLGKMGDVIGSACT